MAESPQQTLAWRALQYGDAGVHVMHVANHGANPPHDHVFHELVFIQSGTAEHHTADGVQHLRPGDVIVLRPQAWHAYREPRGLELFNCLIDSATMQRLTNHLKEVEGAYALFRRREPHHARTLPALLHAPAATAAAIRHRLNILMAEQRHHHNGWQALMHAGLLELLVAVARLHQVRRPDTAGIAAPASRTDRTVLDVASYIETHYRESVTLAALASRAGVSPPHLSRCFARKMGMGLIHYLHRVRAEEACRLLRCTSQSIGDIATDVGYQEIAYFSRQFRAQIGQSPRQYRNAWMDTDPRAAVRANPVRANPVRANPVRANPVRANP